MICAVPIGFTCVLISFVALKVAIARKFPNPSENTAQTAATLTFAIKALLGFSVICFVVWILDVTQDYEYLFVLLFNLFIFNSVCIYLIESRSELKTFVRSKFQNIPFIPKSNIVNVEIQ